MSRLHGRFDATRQDYKEGAELCKRYIAEDPRNEAYYQFCRLSFEIGILKLDIFENLRKKYLEKDMDYIKRVAYEYLPEIIKCTGEFYDRFQKNWDETNSPLVQNFTRFAWAGDQESGVCGSENGQIHKW